jgi:FKBP-type peptidyl-prolyl cis-trans isomerase
MKLKHTIPLCVVALGLVAARAQDMTISLPGQPAQKAAPTAAAPAAPAANFSEAQILEELGWFFGKKIGLSELGFSKSEIDSMIKGMNTAAEGKDSPYNVDQIGPMVDQYMQKKQEAFMAKMKQKNVADNAAFFAKLKENKSVQELPSGLRYEILKPGTGAYPKPEDTVKVNYTGRLIDGTVFDSSEGGEPAVIGLKQVIPGWTEGVQKINKGGKIRLYIPPELGYKDAANPGIPPSSTLIFDVELLDINPTPAAPAAQPAQPAK